VGSALVIGGLFLPWYHADARYLVGDLYPSDFQPFIPMQPFNGSDLLWLTLAAFPVIAALVCPAVDATPLLRRQWLIIAAAICLGSLTLVAGGVGIIFLILYPGLLTLAGTVPKLLDWGYFVTLTGYILLVPGAVLLMIGQRYIRQMVRLGRLRAP
jgi:hypothetical protein